MEECEQRRRKEELQKTEERIEKDSDKAKKEYLENIRQEIMELKRAGRHEGKEMCSKEHHRIQNIGTEDSKGNTIVDKTKVLRIWEIYIAIDPINQKT